MDHLRTAEMVDRRGLHLFRDGRAQRLSSSVTRMLSHVAHVASLSLSENLNTADRVSKEGTATLARR
jgi:hypothetical protein